MSLSRAIAFVLLACGSGVVVADEPLLNTDGDVIVANIRPGASAVDVALPVRGMDGIALDLVIPASDAQFTLSDPRGVVRLRSGERGVKLEARASLPNGTTGIRYTTDRIDTPLSGTWKLHITLSGAAGSAVLATLHPAPRYQLELRLSQPRVLLGEPVTVQVLVLDRGAPVLGLHPLITLISPAQPPAEQSARDDAHGYDDTANDGIYTAGYTIAQAGAYTITARARVDHGARTLSATRPVTVSAPTAAARLAGITPTLGPGGCVAALGVELDVNVQQGGAFLTSASLRAANGNTVENARREDFQPGSYRLSIAFPAATLAQRLQTSGGTYEVSRIEITDLTRNLPPLRVTHPGGAARLDVASLCAE